MIEVEAGLYRGPSPQNESDWQQLADSGIKFILDLQTGVCLMRDGSPLVEILKGDDHGIKTFLHPLGEILPPTKKELDDAFWILIKNKPLYVHCKTGVDRTGMVIAYWRIQYFKWSKQKAIAEMKQAGMHWWYYWWSWFLKDQSV